MNPDDFGKPAWQTLPLSPRQRHLVDSLLDDALDLPEEARHVWLAARAGEDPRVISEVKSLLRAARAANDFLSKPPTVAFENLPEDVAAGSQLGVWKIIRRVGRGGMGVVYEAVRARGDFEHRVAIKLLQQEADAQSERFQAERQILARLEHPGIARLYDGGVTEDGRPYMAMEFVEGRTITDYCRDQHASLDTRLRLFMQVCEAVAYAHRNLVVHRDLKPSNILVTADGRIKLLDFGVAKLIDAQRTQLTELTLAPLTPSCAAPEQLTGDPVTTATDVYALGLLLFELMTGTHPWAGRDGSMVQAMRTVLQREPPVASTSASGNAQAPVAQKAIRGDLDAIIAKALRTEPKDRYPTVDALRLDIARVISGDAVEARHGARLYVFARTLRRYRWTAAGVAAVMISLAVGLGLAAWQANRAAIERDIARRDAAREEAVRYSLTRLFRSAIEERGSGPATAKSMVDRSALRVLDEYRDRPQLAGQLVLTLADLYGALEDVSGAGTLLEGFVSQARPDTDLASLADARQKLANIELLRGHPDRAATLLDRADAFWARSSLPYAEERLEGLGIRAKLQRMQGDLDGAVATSRQAIARRIALSGHDHRETAILYNSLAITLTAANRLDEALPAYHETMNIYRALGMSDGLDAQIIMANTGTLEFRVGHLREAEVLLKGAFERERALAGDSAAVAAAMGYYGKLLGVTNRTAPAIAVLREAADLGARFAGPTSPVALQNIIFLGEAQTAAAQFETAQVAGAQFDAAKTTLAHAHDAALAQYGAAHILSLRSQLALAQLAVAEARPADAHDALPPLIAGLRKLGPPGLSTLALALETLGDAESALGDAASARLVLEQALALQEEATHFSWEAAVTRERLGEAVATGGNTAAAAVLLNKASRDLAAQLGVDHPQAIRARQALSQLHPSAS